MTTTRRPEEGRNSGASVSVATRGGTNEFHGTVLEYFRNRALNASDWLPTRRGPRSRTSAPPVRLRDRRADPEDKNLLFGSCQGQNVNAPADRPDLRDLDVYTPSARPGPTATSVPIRGVPSCSNGQTITRNTPLLSTRGRARSGGGARVRHGRRPQLRCQLQLRGGRPKGPIRWWPASSILTPPNNFNTVTADTASYF